jgi:hypothetical protein
MEDRIQLFLIFFLLEVRQEHGVRRKNRDLQHLRDRIYAATEKVTPEMLLVNGMKQNTDYIFVGRQMVPILRLLKVIAHVNYCISLVK